MESLLIIDDNTDFAGLLSEYLASELRLETFIASDIDGALKILNEHSGEISIALVDFYFQGMESGTAVEMVNNFNIPAIVMADAVNDEIQEFANTKKAIDYAVKKGPHSLEYIGAMIDRLIKNRNTTILIVDDSQTVRFHIRGLLELHQYSVLEAKNGSDAMEILRGNEDIKLVLLDYNLPDIDGLVLMKQIRGIFPMNRLAIIGISAEGNQKLSVRFLKEGANDFISKPFASQQLYCRIMLNIKILEQFKSLHELSVTDFLTRLYNRRYFFELAPKLFKSSRRYGTPLAIAMIDIDFFKKINDRYGHNAGDAVLKSIASAIQKFFRESDLLARFGGEEFCVLANNMKKEDARRIFEKLRKKIEDIKYKISGDEFKVTVSIGLCVDLKETLNDMIKTSDENLYISKNTGRNRVTL